MLFLKDIETLRKETGENKLSKAIAQVMKDGKHNQLWIDEVLNSSI
jgi:Cu-processing system ATP-binding protein